MTLHPELASLRLLVAVGKSGSITEAARLEGLSQPAASKRIAALERSMAVSLVERTPSGSRLTSEGRVAVDWASRVLDTVDQMLGAVSSMRSDVAPDLRVAASMTVAEHLVPAWLLNLRATTPEMHVGLNVTNSHEVQRLVLDDEADIGFVEGPTLDPRLDARHIAHDRLAVVVAADHPWAHRRAALRADDLVHAQLIVREPGSGTRETLDSLLEPAKQIKPLLELGSNASVKGAVKAGIGAAVLSVLAVAEELQLGQLVEISVEDIDLHRPLRAVWPRGHKLGAPSRALLQVASQHGANLTLLPQP